MYTYTHTVKVSEILCSQCTLDNIITTILRIRPHYHPMSACPSQLIPKTHLLPFQQNKDHAQFVEIQPAGTMVQAKLYAIHTSKV